MLTRICLSGVLACTVVSVASACDEDAKAHVVTRAAFLHHDHDHEADKAFFGISLGEHDDGIAILSVIDDTPAQRAGFQDGDIILRLDDHAVDGVEAFVKLIGEYKPGDDVLVEYQRDDRNSTRTITLGSRSDHDGVFSFSVGSAATGNNQWFGLPEELTGRLHGAGGNVKVDVTCEDGKGVATIERNGEVETHEFDCSSDEPQFFFHGNNHMMVLPDMDLDLDVDVDEHLRHFHDMHLDLGDLESRLDAIKPLISRRRIEVERAPRIRFKEDPNGRIEVIIRGEDTELIKVFSSAEDLEDRDPELYEKYDALND